MVLPDFTRGFVVETDASANAIGTVLSQDWSVGLRPVQFYSRKLSSAERNYATHKRELLAIVTVVQWWRPYLDGWTTRVVTDHKPIEYFNTQPTLSKR